jgi:DNA (cytosine-5)-methyltransferase 1
MDDMLTAGALFAGIGGFCLGFESANIITKWAVENDPAAVITYSANIPHPRIIKEQDKPVDIRCIKVGTHSLEPVDILHAGFPCQSFSQAGEKMGFDDPRGQLFYEVIRLINEFKDRKPAIIVLENAPFLRMGNGGAWFLEIIKEIRKSGYWFRESNCEELDTFELTSLPQKRKRLFMVAISMSKFSNGKISFPKKSSSKKKDLSKYIDFDGHVDDDTYYLPKENRYYQMISREVEDKRCIYQLRKYLVRVKDAGVCPTLTANMGLGGHNVPFVHDEKGLRKLTEYECLRLQGFPQNYYFPEAVPRHKRYTQVGNSVAVPIAALLADVVKNKFMEIRS